jgi:hypothetical protein
MPKPKPVYCEKIAIQIEKMAARCVRVDEIAKIIGINECLLRPNALYREAWEKGKSLGSMNVKNTYFKMATSGKDWGATKHYLATQCDIIEPRAPENEVNNIIGSLSEDQIKMLKDKSLFNNAAKIVAYIPDNGRLKKDGDEETN